MTDAEALSQVQDFLSTDPDGEVPHQAIGRALALAFAHIATMKMLEATTGELTEAQNALHRLSILPRMIDGKEKWSRVRPNADDQIHDSVGEAADAMWQDYLELMART